MIIYVDELFFINFIACYIYIYLFAAFTELERKTLRLLLSAAVGALIAVMRFCNSGLLSLVLLIAEIIIPKIAFKAILFRNVLLFILMKYILSGLSILAVSMFGGTNAVIRSGIIYFNIRASVFIAIFLIVYPLLTITLKLIKRRRKIYSLRIRQNNNSIVLHALYDSGNLLKNPYDGSNVIIVQKNYLDFDESNGFMLIPFRALGNSGMIKAFKADEIYCMEKSTYLKNVTIGISEMTLSKTGQYQALIGPGIFKE